MRFAEAICEYGACRRELFAACLRVGAYVRIYIRTCLYLCVLVCVQRRILNIFGNEMRFDSGVPEKNISMMAFCTRDLILVKVRAKQFLVLG